MSSIDEAIKHMNRVAAEHQIISNLVWEGRGKKPDDTLPDRIREILALWDNANEMRQKALARVEVLEAELKHVQGVLALRERQGNELAELLKPYIPAKLNEPEVFAGARGALARIAELEAKLAAHTEPAEPTSLTHDIAAVLNKWSAENGSNTPDWILADFLHSVLGAFDHAVQARGRYGRMDVPGNVRAFEVASAVEQAEVASAVEQAERRAEIRSIAVGGGVKEAAEKWSDEEASLRERDPDKVVAGISTPIERKVAAQTKVPPFCVMERAAALWDLLAKIENTGPWGDSDEARRYHGEVVDLAAERHRYFGVCGDQLVPVGEFGVGPVGRWTREEMAIEAAASKVFDAPK